MTSPTKNSQDIEAGQKLDVCLLLEGTYPYVRGGVSTWVHQIVSAMPDLNFGIVYLGAERKSRGELSYEIPGNVLRLEHVFLFDDPSPGSQPSSSRAKNANAVLRRTVRDLLDNLAIDADSDRDADIETELDFRPILRALATASSLAPEGFDEFWTHPDTWQIARDIYQQRLAEESFIDTWWNLRFMLRPIWRLTSALEDVPQAAVYHSVSTGYAGLLGSLASDRFDASFLLSEHGIYVRERIAELLRADWTPRMASPIDGESISAIRELWIEKFIELGRVAYHSAAKIVSLFQKNADHQIEFGAPANRVTIIPNGVDLSSFDDHRRARQKLRAADPERRNVGFLGRVVAIKDIKTLLRAAAYVITEIPAAQFLIMGPVDEDAEYAQHCRDLCRQLGIENRIEFTGPKNLDEALPAVDVMVLPSISEGLPFVALEAFSADIPLVATDVGACRELVEGRQHRHADSGPAGIIVPVGEPVALGQAIARLLGDRALQDKLGATGRRRVETVYAEADVIAAYRGLYETLPAGRRLTTEH
jgi:glycosyltransferase involved in cell wall biosynthesis